MKYGQIIEWMGSKNGVACRFSGKVLDVIPAGEAISESTVAKERKIIVSQSDISIYDRVLAETRGEQGNVRYHAPRLAKIRRI